MAAKSFEDACEVIRYEIRTLKDKDAVLREWELRLEADLAQVRSTRNTLMSTIAGLTRANTQLGN